MKIFKWKFSIYSFLLKAFVKIDKRQRFILSTLFLTVLVFVSSFLSFNQAIIFILLSSFFVYFFTFFSVLEEIDGAEWLMLFLMPIIFTITFCMFFFLLPGRWLTRIPFVLIYSISIYAILLCQNIFNVGEMKNLQLYKAAFSVNFLFLIVTSFLLCNLVLSLKLNFLFNFFLISLSIYPLIMHFLWSINPKTIIEKHVFDYSFITALIVGELAMILSFLPLKSNIFALLLTTCFYSIGGLIQAYIEERLFKERIQEFIFVLIFIFVMALFTMVW